MRLSVSTRLCLSSLALFAGLSACADGVSNTDTIVPLVVPIYAPSESDIPVPNDLLFADTTDLTLNIPVANPADASDPPVAMNTQDGWSVGAPFPVAFSGPIDLASAIPGGSVRIFSVTTNTTMGPVGGPITGVTGELTAADFMTALAAWDTTGSTLEIRPTQPLAPQTTYMVVLTDGITDAAGNPITTDAEYTIASSTTLLPPDHPMYPLQILVLSMEGAAEAAGVDRESIAMAYHFTTQSVAKTLMTISTVAAMGAAGEQAIIDGLCGLGLVDCSSGTAPEIGSASIGTAVDTTLTTTATGGMGIADWYTASLSLPYFLTAASNTTASGPSFDPAPLLNPWAARYPLTALGGNEKNLTAYNLLPHPTGDEQVPVLISVPNWVAKPAAGWPVTIFSHGITANRLSMAGIADSQAGIQRVVIGIDLPLHGLALTDPFFSGYQDGTTRERTFGLDLMNETTGAPGPDGVIDSSGAHMINLGNLTVGRDNLRQGVSDLLMLYSVLGSLDLDGDLSPDLDTSNVNFIGHSLGGMVGLGFLSTVQAPTAIASSLGMPGGGISKLLNASQTFGPRVQAGLAGQGVLVGTEDYESFLWAAQTVLDTVDPIHHIRAVTVGKGLPIHLLEVVGGGNSGLTDAVVPTSVPDAPLSGTEPLITIGGLDSWTQTQIISSGGTITDGGNPLQGAVRFIEGTHASLVSPGVGVDEAAAFAEMGAEMFTFGASGGTSITFPDTTVIQ
ncbi:MAG: Ig-like domain-containing protein [Planctomycetota bacterium]|nr:Ig-like domain-containing protein [Planctomycetota bacterium]